MKPHSFFLLLLTTAAAVHAATTQPSTQPTANDLEVHEWGVFVVDGATGQLNPEGTVTATLPGFIIDHRFGSAGAPAPADATPVRGRRMVVINRRVVTLGGVANPAAAAEISDNDEPSPVGVIRLVGSVDSKMDVRVQAKGGTFLGSWPKAEERSNELLWRDLTVADQGTTILSAVGPNHWFNSLRSAKSAMVSGEHAGSEKFLLYDLEMPYPDPIKAKEDKDLFVDVSNATAVPLHDLVLYQGAEHDTIRTATVGDLTGTTSAHPSETTAAQATNACSRLGIEFSDVKDVASIASGFGYTGNGGLFIQLVQGNSAGKLQPGDVVTAVDGKPAPVAADFVKLITDDSASAVTLTVFHRHDSKELKIDLGKSTTVKASADPSSRRIQLHAAPTTQPFDLADAWKPMMSSSGVDPADADVIEHLITKYAFDPHRLTAVYRMDDAEFDRLLPLEVVPQPAKIKRFGLVIVLNADPSGGTAIDDLVKQLGDDDWSKRDAAYKTLAAMGPAAKDKLTTASKNSDLEIAWRAERLLALSPAAK